MECENMDMLGPMVWAAYREKGWREGEKTTNWLRKMGGNHISEELGKDENAFRLWIDKKLRIFEMNASGTVKTEIRTMNVLTNRIIQIAEGRLSR